MLLGERMYETRLAPVQKNQKRDLSQTAIDFRRSRVNRNIDELLAWKLTLDIHELHACQRLYLLIRLWPSTAADSLRRCPAGHSYSDSLIPINRSRIPRSLKPGAAMNLQSDVELVLLQVADEQVGDREEDRQPHEAVPERRVLGHDRVDRRLDQMVNDVGGQRILAERAEQADLQAADVAEPG